MKLTQKTIDRGASMRISPDRMVGVLGAAPKPATVWQEQFDDCGDVLVRLSQPTGVNRPQAKSVNVWQNLWPLFASSLHQTGAAIRARISANPAQTRYAGSGFHLSSAP